jgi:hypothetical protein
MKREVKVERVERVESGKEKWEERIVGKSREWEREKSGTYLSHTVECIKSWKLDERELEYKKKQRVVYSLYTR